MQNTGKQTVDLCKKNNSIAKLVGIKRQRTVESLYGKERKCKRHCHKACSDLQTGDIRAAYTGASAAAIEDPSNTEGSCSHKGGDETLSCISSNKNANTTSHQSTDILTQDLGNRCSVAAKKRKHRRKPARKRTPKTSILPSKRSSSADDTQENIIQMNTRCHIIKAKRRRLYVREHNEGQCPVFMPYPTEKTVNGDPTTSMRLAPARKSKTAALIKMQEQDIPFPKGAYCQKNIKDLDNVQVAIAPSSIPHAGLGLFLITGPSDDGSAPPGTRVAMYDGIHFRTKEEQEWVRSDKYQSDYAWEGLNPYTGETVIVDGSPLTSYGPYMNDGLDHKEANVTLVFGTDGKIYVETITTVSKHSELLFSNGQLYWLDPAHWNTIPEETKASILRYYKCEPPRTRIPTTSESSSLRNNSLSGNTASLDFNFVKCYGSSQDDNTRLSFCHLEETLPAVLSMRDNLSRVNRTEAMQTLVHHLKLNDDLPIVYWKKLDHTHYRDSPPDGACGWYTMAQAITRHHSGALLNLYSKEGLLQAANILESIQQFNYPCSSEGLQALPVAIEWIKRKHLRPRDTLEYRYQLFSEDYTTFLDMIPTTLFILPSAEARESSIQMPKDFNHTWLSLHSTTSVNRVGHESHVSAFPLRTILTVAKGELFTQLAGGHYFLFPPLHDEQRRCEQALQDLAHNMWDSLHSSKVNLLRFPNSQTQGNLEKTSANNSSRSTKPTLSRPPNRLLKTVDTTTTVGPTLLASTISQHEHEPTRLSENAEDNSPQVISKEPTIRHCYGRGLPRVLVLFPKFGSFNFKSS